jgi:hypothetical protein
MAGGSARSTTVLFLLKTKLGQHQFFSVFDSVCGGSIILPPRLPSFSRGALPANKSHAFD